MHKLEVKRGEVEGSERAASSLQRAGFCRSPSTVQLIPNVLRGQLTGTPKAQNRREFDTKSWLLPSQCRLRGTSVARPRAASLCYLPLCTCHYIRCARRTARRQDQQQQQQRRRRRRQKSQCITALTLLSTSSTLLSATRSPCPPYLQARPCRPSVVLSKVGASMLDARTRRRHRRLRLWPPVALFCRPALTPHPLSPFPPLLAKPAMPLPPPSCPRPPLSPAVVSGPVLPGASLRNVTDLFRSVCPLLLLPEQHIEIWARLDDVGSGGSGITVRTRNIKMLHKCYTELYARNIKMLTCFCWRP